MVQPAVALAGAIHSSHEVVSSASTPAPSGVDKFFADERAALRLRLENEPTFSPFRSLPDGLLTFLCAEKMRLSLTPETRSLRDKTGKIVSGYEHHYDCQEDKYHPAHFEPFNLKGFWIPEKDGQFFSIQQPPETCPLIRTGREGREVLFLIHPKSEACFSPLMQKYAQELVLVPALSLSSFRTLLIAVPGASGSQYAMVKVSLDETIGGALRLLHLKECAGSVARTAVLQHKPSSIAFMQENFSFVPNAKLYNTQAEKAYELGAGMIHRLIPDCLSNPASNEYVISLFALFGSKNRALLDVLIDQSKKSPTQFVVDSLLKPLADGFVDLLYGKNVSIEAHGQNVLLVINASNPNEVQCKLLYRDMGGVNCLLSKTDKEKLPQALTNESYYYFDTHVKDAADVLEGVARKVLFNLTKQFFKSERYDCIDPQFGRWKSEMLKRGFSENWTIAGDNPDAHGQNFTEENFYRYGYFEKIFGQLLLESMSRKGIFIELADYQPDINYSYFYKKLCDPENPYNTCVEIEWFKELVLQTYPQHLAHH